MLNLKQRNAPSCGYDAKQVAINLTRPPNYQC